MFFGDPLKPKTNQEVDSVIPLTISETAKLGVISCFIYFGMNYFSTISFGLTSIGSASILASTCGFFTLIIGRIAGVEKLSFFRVVSVLIGAAGVVILGVSEFTGQDTKALGNMFAILGAALYGLNSVVLKKASGDESRISTLNLFAFVGLYVTILSPIFFALLHYTNIEPFELPSNNMIYLFLIINIVFGSLIPNYLWNIAFAYTSELVVAIGISFTTPLTLVVEYFTKPELVTVQKMLSAACIIIAFGVVNVAEIQPDWEAAFIRSMKNMVKRT
jgi:solute carrier family 35 protein F5